MAQRYRLKLNRLDFVSPVDTPAQETATVVLLKRDAGEEIDGKARVVKMDDSLGLVFCWAFTSSVDNAPYFDLQGDAIDEDFVKAAAEFMEHGGATDEMHDGQPDGRVLFAMPMTPEIAKAFGVVTKTTGLMVALKPSPDVYAKFKSGEYTGVSIAGLGERQAVKAVRSANPDHFDETGDSWRYRVRPESQFQDGSLRTIALGKDTGVKAVVGKFPGNDVEHIQTLIFGKDKFKTKASAAAWIHKNPDVLRQPHTKRADVEKVIRKLPDGKYGLFTADGKKMLSKHPTKADAQKQENAIHAHENSEKRVAKGLVLLTSETDGHQHAIELNRWRYPTTTYGTSEGADQGHCHAWIVDAAGKVTIGADSGHSHDVEGLVPADILACWNDDEDAVCEPVADDDDSGATVVVVTARANSTPTPAAKQALDKKEPTMADTKLIVLTEAQHAHYAKLAGDEATAFLAKSHTDREVEVAKAIEADPVVFKGTRTGVEVRKSHGDLAKKLAEQNAANAETLAKQADALSKANDAREHEVLKRRVRDEIGNLAGSDDAKIALLKAASGIADEKLRGEVVEALKAADAALVQLGKANGSSGGDAGDANPLAVFNKRRDEFAKEQKLDTATATAKFLATSEGAELYQATLPTN